MPRRDQDEAVIEQFKNDLRDMTPEKLRQQIRETQDVIDEHEPWLEALHAYARKMDWSTS